MAEPAYVALAGAYARQIRCGQLTPGVRLPSYAELVERHAVSEIVARKAIQLLQSQGLVRCVRRQGVYVADRINLVRVSPERQRESAETSFGNESEGHVTVERESSRIPASAELAEAFDLTPGQPLTRVVTKAAEDGRPISISDTYQPLDVADASGATWLEETVADRLPSPEHAQWLRTRPGDLVKTVHQLFCGPDGRLLMRSDVSYPRDRYDAFTFRMTLRPETPGTEE
jgi:GntR family transcriptional regulator